MRGLSWRDPVACLLAVPAAQAQESEVLSLARELVRVNTSNPPGNEAQVAELLRPRLQALGFEVDVIQTPAPGKAHLVARLRAAGPTEKPILLAGHADTVGVEPALWTVNPFAGVTSGDYLLGRGSLDFKGGLAAFTVAAMRLARERVPLKRDVILLVEADEEGGSYGTRWLATNHWDKIDAGVSLNEGGWIFKGAGGRPRLMGITTIDKNSLSVTVRTRGTSTHSSRPLPDSAIRRLVRALRRIDLYDKAPRITPTARRYFRVWANAFGAARASCCAGSRTPAAPASDVRPPTDSRPAASESSSTASRATSSSRRSSRAASVPTCCRGPPRPPSTCGCSPARTRGP